MSKSEMYDYIYPYFYSVVMAYYYQNGSWGDLAKSAFETLKIKSKEIGLTADLMRMGEDIVIFVENPEEYTLVSTKLDIYTYEDEEMEAE